MIKLNKIIIVMLILFSIFALIYRVNASGINMNLSNESDYTTYGSSRNTSTSSSRTNNNTQQSSVVVSSASQSTSEGLTISDMINIILCAVGIILVLLGIAILIRQKG